MPTTPSLVVFVTFSMRSSSAKANEASVIGDPAMVARSGSQSRRGRGPLAVLGYALGTYVGLAIAVPLCAIARLYGASPSAPRRRPCAESGRDQSTSAQSGDAAKAAWMRPTCE